MAAAAPDFGPGVFAKRDIVCDDTQNVSQAYADALSRPPAVVEAEVQAIERVVGGGPAYRALAQHHFYKLRQVVYFQTACLGRDVPPDRLRELIRACQMKGFKSMGHLSANFSSPTDPTQMKWYGLAGAAVVCGGRFLDLFLPRPWSPLGRQNEHFAWLWRLDEGPGP